VLKPTRAKNARIKAFMIRDIRVIRGQTVLRQSPFANLAPLRETLARQHFRSHRLCIRYIRVIRGQTDARHPPTQFRDLLCHSVAASLAPIA
jgi:hypothetical protein